MVRLAGCGGILCRHAHSSSLAVTCIFISAEILTHAATQMSGGGKKVHLGRHVYILEQGVKNSDVKKRFGCNNSFIHPLGHNLHCTLASAQHIVKSVLSVCVWMGVCGSVTMITRKCVHRTLPNWIVVGKGSDRLQLVKFWPSCAHGKGSAAGQRFLTPPYYSQRTVFASLWAHFSLTFAILAKNHKHTNKETRKPSCSPADLKPPRPGPIAPGGWINRPPRIGGDIIGWE